MIFWLLRAPTLLMYFEASLKFIIWKLKNKEKISCVVISYWDGQLVPSLCFKSGLPNPQTVAYYRALSPSESGCGNGRRACALISICVNSRQAWAGMLYLCEHCSHKWSCTSKGKHGCVRTPFTQGAELCTCCSCKWSCVCMSLLAHHSYRTNPSPCSRSTKLEWLENSALNKYRWRKWLLLQTKRVSAYQS